MFFNYKITTLFWAVLFFTVFSVRAETIERNYIVVAPHCLIENAAISYATLSVIDRFSLIKINESAFNRLITAKTQQKNNCGGFINVTDAYHIDRMKTLSSKKSFLAKYVVFTELKQSVREIGRAS